LIQSLLRAIHGITRRHYGGGSMSRHHTNDYIITGQGNRDLCDSTNKLGF
jgi:hypothetical protein